MPEIVDRHPLIEEILDARRNIIGPARTPYGGHVYRVFNFCRTLHAGAGGEDAIAIASAFHDLAVFPDGNLDYLGPSAAMMREWAEAHGRAALAPEMALMIEMHHKLTRYRGAAIRFGLPKEFVRDVRGRFPNAGFHATLVKVIGGWMVRHPTNPVPILRL
jgi:hypothetical protein